MTAAWRRAVFVILLCLSAMALRTHAEPQPMPQRTPESSVKPSMQSACPWLNEGSAVRALGGPVSMAVQVSDAGEGSCRFAQVQDATATLEILVSRQAMPACPAGSVKLKGIGNEAAICDLTGSTGSAGKRISSRVRDLFFTVTLSSRRKSGNEKASDAQDVILEQIAEQIAGNLF